MQCIAVKKKMGIKKKHTSELLKLKNVGPATLRDLQLLGITAINQLAEKSADELYTHLEKVTNKHHDLCMWDVFAAIIYEAQTGRKEGWWKWTQIRKNRGLILCSHKSAKK